MNKFQNFKNKYLNNINIVFLILLALGAVVIFSMKPDKYQVLNEEFEALEERISTNRKLREEARQQQEERYKAWQEADKVFNNQIEKDKERLRALSTLLDKQPTINLIPTAQASWTADSTPASADASYDYKDIDILHSRICSKQKNSPLCSDKQLLKRLEQITKERSDKEYLFPMLLGIINSESSLGTNFAPHEGCKKYNNWGWIKWRKTDDNQSIKDQPIPQADGCWLYQFDSIEDYWISKVNTIRFGYAGCLGNNPTEALQCISRYYVGNTKNIKHSWVNNASIFIN